MDGKQKVPFSNLFALLFLGNAWEWIFDKINCHTIGILQKKKKKKKNRLNLSKFNLIRLQFPAIKISAVDKSDEFNC